MARAALVVPLLRTFAPEYVRPPLFIVRVLFFPPVAPARGFGPCPRVFGESGGYKLQSWWLAGWRVSPA